MLAWAEARIFFGGPGRDIIKAAAVILAAVIIYRFARAGIGRVLVSGRVHRRYLDKRRADTLASTLTSLLRYTLYFLSLGTVLPLLGVNISALIAAAGIGGVAIAFGAQHLIRDVITGFFILLEGHLAVGDQVIVAGVTGEVVEAGLRVTRIRDADGRLHVIPNGQIVQVTVLSTNARLGQVEVPIGPRTDLVLLEKLIERVCHEFAAGREFVESPRSVGLVATSSGPAWRVSFKVPAGSLVQYEAELRRSLYQAVTEAGIRWRLR